MLRKNFENETKELKIHFIYAGNYYWHKDKVRSFILKGMKKYNIKSVMVTRIYMERWRLIRKEAMGRYCSVVLQKSNPPLSKKQVLSPTHREEDRKTSVNDDLESLYEDLRLGKEPDEEVQTYFLPKLTEKEMKLVERKNTTFLQTFYFSHPDVEAVKKNLPESDSKFVEGLGWRTTFTIDNLSSSKNSNCCSLQ